ncbi:MBL fold metallo-hydrolase [Desulfurivibrio alkaliphilus]|uniref:Beta-lactamase domain-containing protein n=1 Tax=Desulfurivibrio alkaliphilus (strain DSM 19089 / UNIQEM U267 / AHT2) TaxID=589865 RepID=D6Z4S8_DESAT|nr:MBL fold metallo-hydrolase [Desulfurivibrio alkaliphilus]ADH86553.1 beta-lactamase domain-containing protein [Desulfurivibrio alkaliphilus AHT 2]
MRFCVLGGGSKGNATYVEAGETRLLIDAGFSGRELETRLDALGIDPAGLSAVLLSHEHGDHIRGAGVLSRRYHLPLYANRPTLQAAARNLGSPAAVHEFTTGATFTCGAIKVHPFAVSHDAAEPVGFLLQAGGLRLGHCTDLGMVSRLARHRLTGCHALVLECNHDPEMLATGPYTPALKQRVRSRHGHLANHEAAELLAELLHPGLSQVVLSHLSETNNTPELAAQAVQAAITATAQPPPQLTIACQQKGSNICQLTPNAK